ncbi:MAG TPA: hypothetical protein VNI01_02710 [Elusimicrobiota bacterium]|nr:hypothetical protein [Elusimicrobiota bacterium]
MTLAVLLAATLQSASAQSAPLDSSDSGLYGGVPASSAAVYSPRFLELTKGMTFYITKMSETDPTRAIEGIRAAPPGAVLLRVDVWSSDAERLGKAPLPDSGAQAKRLRALLAAIPPELLAKLRGIVLSEENVPWAGHPKRLAELYWLAKKLHPDLPVYQWWTPNDLAPAPRDGAFLPADGWVIDSYTLSPKKPGRGLSKTDPYRNLVQKYLVTGKPLVPIVWASDQYPDWYDPAGLDVGAIVRHQLAVHREFDLPTGFYWVAQIGSVGSVYAIATSTSPLMQRINADVTGIIGEASARPPAPSSDRWPADGENPPRLELGPNAKHPECGTYADDFSESRFLNDSAGEGFHDLVWRPKSLQIRGPGRPASVVLRYHLHDARVLKRFSLWTPLRSDPALAEPLRADFSLDGKRWTPMEAKAQGAYWAPPKWAGTREFWLRLTLSAKPSPDGKPAITMPYLSMSGCAK